MTKAEYQKEILDNPDFGGEFTDAQKFAISSYAGVLSGGINRGLREGNGKILPKNFIGQEHIGMIHQIDAAIDSHHLPYNTVLYRASKFKTSLRAGGTIVDHGFVSTSFSQKAATENFATPKAGLKSYVLRIHAPKGINGIVSQKAFSPTLLSKSPWVPEEKEFILTRGTIFKIQAIHDVPGAAYKLVDVEV